MPLNLSQSNRQPLGVSNRNLGCGPKAREAAQPYPKKRPSIFTSVASMAKTASPPPANSAPSSSALITSYHPGNTFSSPTPSLTPSVFTTSMYSPILATGNSISPPCPPSFPHMISPLQAPAFKPPELMMSHMARTMNHVAQVPQIPSPVTPVAAKMEARTSPVTSPSASPVPFTQGFLHPQVNNSLFLNTVDFFQI